MVRFEHPKTASCFDQVGWKRRVKLNQRRLLKRLFWNLKNPLHFMSHLLRKKFDLSNPNNDLLQGIRDYGYGKINDKYLNSIFKSLSDKYIKILPDYVKIKPTKVPKSPLSQIQIYSDPLIFKLLKNKQLNEVMQKYLRMQPKFCGASIWLAVADGNVNGSPLLHVDSGSEKIIRLYVYLNDINASNGAFHYVRRRISKKFINYSGYLGNAIIDDDFERIGSKCGVKWSDVKPAVGKAGSSFIIDSAQCLHFGSRMKKGSRLVLILSWMMDPDSDEGLIMREEMRNALTESGNDVMTYPSLLN